MAKQIALNLTINGVKNSITNIEQLSTAIKEAEEDLKQIDIGSKNFEQLSGEIRNAKNVLQDFNKSIEGQDAEKRIGAFAKVGEAVTASFAGAQAAIGLFGAESEEISKAAAQAQNLLTVALAARSVQEGIVAVRTVAQTIATQASAAAAAAATTATRTLYATLAANPYGAILAVIGLVIGALLAFTSTSEKATNVSAELAKATSQEADSLKESLTILTRYNNLKALQSRELEKLKKEYPGFNAFISEENKLTEDGIKFIKLRIQQYELEAQAKLLIQKLAENQIKILELESTLSLETLTFWQKAVNTIKTGGNVVATNVENLKTAIANNREEIEKINKSSDLYRGALDNIRVQLDKNLTTQEPYNKALEAQAKANEIAAQKTKDLEEQQKRIAEAQAEGRKATLNLSEEIKKLNEAYADYERTIQRLDKLQLGTKLVDELKKIQEARKSAAQQLADPVIQLRKQLEEIQPDIDTTFKDTFTKFRKANEDLITLGRDGFRKAYGQGFEEFYSKTLNDVKGLTQEQKNILSDLSKGYGDFFSFIDKKGLQTFVQNFPKYFAFFDLSKAGADLQALGDATEDLQLKSRRAIGGAQGFLVALGDIAVAAGDTTLELDELGNVYELQFNPSKVSNAAKKTLASLKKELFEPTYFELLRLKGEGILEQLLTATPEEEAKLQEFLKRIKKSLDTKQIDFTLINQKEVEQQVDATIVQFQKLLSAIARADERILGINKQIQELTKEIGSNTAELSQAIGGVIVQNIDTINKVVFGLRTKQEKDDEAFYKKIFADEEGLAKFKQDLQNRGFDVEKANQDDLLAAFVLFKKKEVEINKQAEKDKQDDQQKTYDKLLRGFELFSQTLNQISSLVQERTQTDLEALSVAQTKALEQVVGDSETAAKKRLEIQTEYEEKRKQIEKKGRITQLRFSQAQTIANTAQAVVKALAELGPIAGPIFAGIAGAIGLAQIAIIEDQISTAQSLRRGGFVKAQGGMIIGPSHENGGVRLAQAGIIAEGNESIINRQSTMDYQSLLSTINVAGGGRPLVYNNFDDSRIVEALAKQNQKPIRAYVLGSEITNEQNISRRLDDLSKI